MMTARSGAATIRFCIPACVPSIIDHWPAVTPVRALLNLITVRAGDVTSKIIRVGQSPSLVN